MKKQILKIAGVKSEKEFYKKFPTEEAFMAKHGKELKKAQIGTYMTSEAPSGMYQPADVRGMYDEIDYQLTGMTAADRAKMQAIQQIAAQSSQSGGGGGMDMSQIAQMAGAAKKGKKITKAQAGENMIGYPTGPQLTPSAQNLQQQQYNWGTNTATSATTKNKFNLTKAIPVIGQVIGGIQSIKAQKEAYRAAKQQTALTDVMSQAAASRPVQQPRRQYVRPEDMAFQPEQMFPSYGVGTNVLAQDGTVINQIGGNPTEIQNMYNPGTLYSDLGYEPLNDSERYKQFYHGGKMHKAANGFMSKFNSSQAGQILGSPEAQQLANFSPTGGYSQVLGGVGGLLGGPIGTVATFIGSALDREKQKQIENQQDLAAQNITNIIGQSFGTGIQKQFGLRNGGILKAQSGKDLTKKDGKCEAEEARNRADRAQGKVDARANAAWDREVAAAERRDVRQNAQQMADYLSEGLTGYGDKIKRKDFEAAYQTFATQNPELAKDRLLYTLANKELNKVRNNPDYLMRNVFRRTDPNLDYKTLTLPQLMQTMQKGYGSGQGYYDAWKEGFPMRQSAIQQVVPIQQENGGQTSPYKWVSHTWQPQVIASFGGHNLKDLLKPPHDADMLRAGGHLKAYTPPSAEAMSTERPMMQMGGELETHWGGYAEPMSYNPYLPDGGETIMFRGQSHDESDGRGNTGIGITYGENPVEVERGEPAVKLQDGSTGESNLTVFGNIKITNAFADMLADPKAKGKKFKTYVADLSKQENKQNKLMDKSIDQLDDLDVQTSFDKLALGTLQANIEGANAKLKDLATKKMDAAALQNAINDSKEENLLDVTDKGDVLAKKGANIPKAQRGVSAGKSRAELANVNPVIKGLFELLSKKNYNVVATSGYRDSITKSGRPSRHSKGEAMDITFPQLGEKAYETILNDSDVAQYMLQNNITAINEYDPETQKATGATGPHIHFGFDKGTPLADKFRNEAATKYPSALTPISQKGLPKINPNDYQYLKRLFNEAKEAKRGPAVLKFQQEYHRLAPEYAKSVLAKFPVTAYGKKKGLSTADLSSNEEGIFGNRTIAYDAALDEGVTDVPVGEMAKIKELGEVIISGKKNVTKKDMQEMTINPYKRSALMDIFNSILPYLRPSDIEELDPNQLIGEMYALSQNQVEPVWAQKFTPELSTPIDISLQDILNENQATYNATARQTGYNPEALSLLNAQKYQANQRVLGEQFRLNQAEKQRVYEQNRNLLNQAELQNLQILERQSDKQAMALSKTKATTQEALNSIASKYAQNKLQNRTLAVMENMYNYRYDPRFRAVNMNPLWQPNIQDVGGAVPIYDKNNKVIGYKSIEEATGVEKPSFTTPRITAKSGKAVKKLNLNGSIVKALKNI
jgi:uncharacterized protein YcbK (DUF882 family)